MKMAKPSARDIEAAEELHQVLQMIDARFGGPFQNHEAGDDLATLLDNGDSGVNAFDSDNEQHLLTLYNHLARLLRNAPNFYGRVIGGMCWVIMNEANQILDPDAGRSIGKVSPASKLSMNDFRHVQVMLKETYIGSVALAGKVDRAETFGELNSVGTASFEITQRTELPWGKRRDWHQSEPLHMSAEPMVMPLDQVTIDRSLTKIVQRPINSTIKHSEVKHRELALHDQQLSNALSLSGFSMGIVQQRKCTSGKYCHNRADRLNPGRGLLARPRQASDQVDHNNQDRREAQRFTHIGKREADVKFLVEHACLPAVVTASSLQARCHHVQQVAA